MKHYLTTINGKQFIYSDSDEKLISQKFAYHTTENKVVELDNMFYSWQSPLLKKLTHSNDSSYSLRKFVVVDEELDFTEWVTLNFKVHDRLDGVLYYFPIVSERFKHQMFDLKDLLQLYHSKPTELEFLKEENGIDVFKKVKVSENK